LDFLNDVCFAQPVESIVEKWQRARRPVFRFLVDQPNPWQVSSRAHHTVDLLYVFGSFDLSFAPDAQLVSDAMQRSWVRFVCSQDPWPRDGYCAFGPFGETKVIGRAEFSARRRVRHFSALQELDSGNIKTIFNALAAKRLSLLN
jgi:hypothetical protein